MFNLDITDVLIIVTALLAIIIILSPLINKIIENCEDSRARKEMKERLDQFKRKDD